MHFRPSFWQCKVYADIRGVPWRGASNDSGVIENVDFQGFQTLHVRHFRKWGQHYYIVLLVPCRLSTDPQNTRWMTLNGHFILFFTVRGALWFIDFWFDLHTYLKVYLYHVTSRDMQKRTVMHRIFGIRRRTGSFIDGMIRHRKLNK